MRSTATSARYAQLWITNGGRATACHGWDLPTIERGGGATAAPPLSGEAYFTFTLGRAATIFRY